MFRRMSWVAAGAAILMFGARPAFAQDGPSGNPVAGVPMPDMLKPPKPGSGNDKSPAGSKKAESSESGKTGGDKFAALYDTFATAWNNPKDLKLAAKHVNRYDVIVFGKKYQKIAGHKVKVKKFKQGKPETSFEVELLDNGISLQGSYSKSYNVFELTAQVFIGPVPVVISAGVGANLGAGVNGNLVIVGPKSAGINAYATAGIGINVAVGIGFSFGCVGVEGAINVLEGTINLTVAWEDGFAVKSTFTVGSSGEINLIAKIAFIKKKYNLWKSPDKVWVQKVLLDHQF